MSLVNVTLSRTRHRRLCSFLNNTVKPFWGPKIAAAPSGLSPGLQLFQQFLSAGGRPGPGERADGRGQLKDESCTVAELSSGALCLQPSNSPCSRVSTAAAHTITLPLCPAHIDTLVLNPRAAQCPRPQQEVERTEPPQCSASVHALQAGCTRGWESLCPALPAEPRCRGQAGSAHPACLSDGTDVHKHGAATVLEVRHHQSHGHRCAAEQRSREASVPQGLLLSQIWV